MATTGNLTLDSSAVEKLRKDFLTLMKNVPRVDTYAKGVKLRDAVKIFRENFNDIIFENWLNRDFKYKTDELSDSDRTWLEKKLRQTGWALYMELSMPLYYADEHMSEGQALQRFKEQGEKWANRTKAKARAFWKEIDEAIEFYARYSTKPGFEVDLPTQERVSMEGFDVLVVGYKHGNYGHDEIDDIIVRFRAALKHFKQRAQQVLPVMLKAMLPIHLIAFLRGLDEGGSYKTHHIEISAFGFGEFKQKNQFAHVIAHEMGHHLYKQYLSAADRKFWDTAISGNYGPVDLDELLRIWPEGAWAFNLPARLKDVNPTLAIQVDLIGRGYGNNGQGPQTREEFQALRDSGKELRAPSNPITGYAGKNTEEAFCEAVGLAIGYGPRAVDPLVQGWLKMILPNIRIARAHTVALRYQKLLHA